MQAQARKREQEREQKHSRLTVPDRVRAAQAAIRHVTQQQAWGDEQPERGIMSLVAYPLPERPRGVETAQEQHDDLVCDFLDLLLH
jgi:hypothetical protein